MNFYRYVLKGGLSELVISGLTLTRLSSIVQRELPGPVRALPDEQRGGLFQGPVLWGMPGKADRSVSWIKKPRVSSHGGKVSLSNRAT